MTTEFYDKYVAEWTLKTKTQSAKKPAIYSVSSTRGNSWYYHVKDWSDLNEAKSFAKLCSSIIREYSELWRVSCGNITVALFENGEEIVDNG